MFIVCSQTLLEKGKAIGLHQTSCPEDPGQACAHVLCTRTPPPPMPTQRALIAWSSLLRSAGLGHPQLATCGERMWSPAPGSHACTRLLLTGAQHLKSILATPQGPAPPTYHDHSPPSEDGTHPASNFKPWVWGPRRGRSNQLPVKAP